tara:strand:- start:4130 stop:5110 length:981 start_codon:yes stop_codon:yes gene_type:complete
MNGDDNLEYLGGGRSVLDKVGDNLVGVGLNALKSKPVKNAVQNVGNQFGEIAEEMGSDGTSVKKSNMRPVILDVKDAIYEDNKKPGRKVQAANDRKIRDETRKAAANNEEKTPVSAAYPAPASVPTASLPPPPATLKRESRQDLTPHIPTSTDDKAKTSTSVDNSDPESESDVTKFLQYFGVNTDNDTNTVYFENLNDFEKNLILYKDDILKKSLLYKIHDIYQGNDILSSFNLWAKMYIFERRSGVKSKTKQTMKNFSELLGRNIYILIKLVIVMWILYILFKSKKPNNFLNVTFKIFIVYYLIFTFIREKQLLLRLRNAFFRGI